MKRLLTVILAALALLISMAAPATAAGEQPRTDNTSSQANAPVRNPAAMALLARAEQTEATDYNLALEQQNLLEIDGGPTIPYEMSWAMQVRGEELLGLTRFSMPALEQEGAILTAVRGGRMFQYDGETWAELPIEAAVGAVPSGIGTPGALLESVRDVQLGTFRWADGIPVRDVVLTLEPSAMNTVMESVMSSMLPATGDVAVDAKWERLDVRFTIDLANGRYLSGTMDASVRLALTAAGEQMGMRITLHQVATFLPGYGSIQWPEGMPE